MKYKVGDKVVNRKDLESGKYYGYCFFTDGMKKTVGAITTILIVRHSYYKLDTCEAYNFVDEMIDHEATAKLNEPTPKSLLKSGDKVTYRDGTERFVLLETGTLHTDIGDFALKLEYFNDKLCCESHKIQDIMKIERGTELIWERPIPQPEPKVIKMTKLS